MTNNVKNSSTLLSLIEPKTVSCFHNQEIAIDINLWIENFYDKQSDKKALMVYGDSGIGKTMLTKLLLKEYNYYTYYFDSTISRSKRWVTDTLHEIMNTNGFTRKKRLIVIDDMDAFTNTNDYCGISEIVKLINPLKGNSSVGKLQKSIRDNTWKLPIIMICNNIKSNKFTDLIKECDIIKFPNPTDNDMYKIAKKCKCLKRDVFSFIPQCNGDVRFFINNIQFHKKDIISKKSDKTMFLYDRVYDMFENDYSSESILQEYFKDPSMIPSLVNENIYSNINPDVLGNIPDITSCISDSDLINAAIHNKMNYELDDMYCYMSVTYPIFLMKKHKHTPIVQVKFPVILGKNAVIYANKQALRAYYIHTPVNCNLDHFCLLRRLLLTYSNNKDSESVCKALEYMIYYNIDPVCLLSSMKVRMFDQCEYKLLKNLKHKKKIKDLYNQSHS